MTLPPLIDPEPRPHRLVYFLLAILLAAGFFAFVACYWVPVHPGTDQNGYLVGGKLVSQTLSMKFAPIRPGTNEFDPHQFVGRMWVGADLGTPAERYYPKYPIGLPLIYAIMLWIGSPFKPGTGEALVYWVNPVAMSLAVLGTFQLSRLFAGSFLGLLATVVFASSPVTVGLATNPNSHAAAVCCVVWGMVFLFRWWQQPAPTIAGDRDKGWMCAIAAGFLLGYAGTIRYSEATLILPIGIVVGLSLSRQRLKGAVALIVAWAVPVGLLVLYNRGAMGTNTGYDPTHESTGFRLKYAIENWETMFRQLDTNGLSLLLPLSLAGLIWMFWWNWRVASVLAGWIVPCMLIYMFYYWAPDGTTIGYLRFFTTILPGLALCFFWFVFQLNRIAARYSHTSPRARWTVPLAIAAVVIALPLVWMASLHIWLGDYSLTSIGCHGGDFWLLRWMTPKDADVDPGAIAVARIAWKTTFTWACVGACSAGLVVLMAFRGRSSLPIIGAGMLTGLVAAMHLTNALPVLEQDQLMRDVVASNIGEVEAIAPQQSVIICADQQLLNPLQFAGDYDLYSGDSFSRDWVQKLPDDDPDAPQGLDPGRRDALYQRLKSLDQNALDKQARALVEQALSAHRRVFVVAPRRDLELQYRKSRERTAKVDRAGKNPLAALKQKLSRQMPDLVQRICAGNNLEFNVAGTWVTYVPRTITVSNSPRGLKIKMDPIQPRRGMELLELTPASVADGH